MAQTKDREDGEADGRPGESRLEQRFRELGARALIDESQRMSDAIAALDRRLAALERSAELLLRLLDFPLPRQGELGAPLLERVVVGARMLLDAGDGFYPVEIGADGMAFRWTGPRQDFRFVVHVQRQRGCRLALTLLNNSQIAGAREMACYIDRSWVPATVSIVEDGRFVRVEAELPPLEAERATEILFLAPSLVSPQETIPGSGDARTLGVAFVELSAEALAHSRAPEGAGRAG